MTVLRVSHSMKLCIEHSNQRVLILLDYGIVGAEIEREITFERQHVTGIAPIFLSRVRFERGMTWDDALKKFV